MRHDGKSETSAARGLGEDTSRQELLEFLDALRRGWWIVLGSGILTVAAAWYSMTQREPEYTAEVLLQHAESPSLAAVASPLAGIETLDFASQLEIIRSRAVLATAVDSLGLQLVLQDHRGERSQIIRGVEVDHAHLRTRYQIARSGSGTTIRDPRTGAVLARADAGDWLEMPGFRVWVDPVALGTDPVEVAVTDFEVALDQLKRRLVVEPGME